MRVEKNESAQRFIILGTARTGSNLLMSLLSAHESIKIYGELFNLDRLSNVELREVLEDPLSYLKKRIYVNLPQGKQVIGFKIFYDHLTKDYFSKVISPDQASDKLKKRFISLNKYIEEHNLYNGLYDRLQKIWDYLATDKDLKIIHLKRRNKLETLVSLKTAYLTCEWMRWKEEQSKTVLHLDYKECDYYFQKIEAYEHAYSKIFQYHNKINVYYENLVNNRGEEMNRIFNFLGLANRPTSTILKKQVVFPLTEVIDNYSSLKKIFSNTQWKKFFN